MKVNIAPKLFLGFLVVILLNASFVAVVSKLSDLTIIANILKRQDVIRNELLRIGSQHGNRKRSRYVYRTLGSKESADNLVSAGSVITESIDSVLDELTTILALDTSVSIRSDTGSQLQVLLETFQYSVKSNSDLYNTTFEELVEMHSRGDRGPVAAKRQGIANEILDTADLNFALGLARTDSLIEAQTKNRIKEIENRVSNVRRLTLIMVAGISLFSLVFGFFFSRAITTSLRRLRETASTIGKGEFEFNPEGFPRDEIGDLAQAFDDMAHDLKATQEELVRSKRLAAIGEIVASVNHEINNPLMIISGNAQFLEMSMSGYPEEMKERVRAILEETERISQVTRKLRRIKNPVVEDYTSSGEQMINLDKSSS